MARRLAAALALLLVAGSCSRGGTNDDVGIGPGPTLSTGAPAAGGPTSPSTVAADGAPRPTRPPGTGANATPPSVGGSKTDIDAAANGAVGRFAGVLLAPGPATSVVVDVRVGDGATPSRTALTNAAQIVRTYSGKPVGINGPLALRNVGGGIHTAEEIRRLATSQGSPNRDGVAVVHLLYLSGSFEQKDVLGVAVRGDTVALFTDEMDNATSPFVTRARIEQAVVNHEVGHVLGLVDLFLDENRDDPDHPGHSRNQGSVMFWAVETSLVGQVLGGPPPVDFDADDIADLKKIPRRLTRPSATSRKHPSPR